MRMHLETFRNKVACGHNRRFRRHTPFVARVTCLLCLKKVDAR